MNEGTLAVIAAFSFSASYPGSVGGCWFSSPNITRYTGRQWKRRQAENRRRQQARVRNAHQRKPG